MSGMRAPARLDSCPVCKKAKREDGERETATKEKRPALCRRALTKSVASEAFGEVLGLHKRGGAALSNGALIPALYLSLCLSSEDCH